MSFNKILLLGVALSSTFLTISSTESARVKKDSFFIGGQVRYTNLLFSGAKAKAGNFGNTGIFYSVNNKRKPTKSKFAVQAGFDSFTDRNIYTALLADVNLGGPKKIDYSTKDTGSAVTSDQGKAKLSNTFAIGGEGRMGYRFGGAFTPFLAMGASLNTIKIYDNTDSVSDTTERQKSYNKLGFMAGVGAIYSINDRFSLETSYKYTKILKLKHEFKGVLDNDAAKPIGTQEITFDQHYISAGLNIHF